MLKDTVRSVAPAGFASRLLHWYDRHGRHDLPWQHPRSFYRVWVAEVMLQQTQVTTVVPYYARFMARFPGLEALALAGTDDVLAHWAGLGYYARARNLHRAAQQLFQDHGGEFPETLEGWQTLPGVGRSTAGAILAQVRGQRHAILDGNVRRVLARHAGIEGWPGKASVTARLWSEADLRLPRMRLADYTQAQMDFGSIVCTARNPRCQDCPLAADCIALRQGRVGALPTARPRSALPSRQATVLLIEDGEGRWLLRRRPPAGIWGGLWCPPLIETGQDWRQYCARNYGLSLHEHESFDPISHSFTHFKLQLRPVRASLESVSGVLEDDACWLTMEQIATRGLPAPMRRLFSKL